MGFLKKEKYYDISHLLKDYPNAQYYIAFGERSNGKTYSSLMYALIRYYKYGEQFAYLRRFGEDIRPKNLSNLLSGHVENNQIFLLSNGAYNLVDYTSGKFIPYNYDETSGKKILAEEPIGYAFDLNSMEHYKGLSFPKVTTIIFDEFLSRQGYLTNEFLLFMNSLSTIIRDRGNVKILMLGNTVNKFCPYFSEMGLGHIKEQTPGTVDVYKYAETGLEVVVEYCDPMSKRGGKSSDVYFAFDNPQLQMITSGSWEIAIYPHLVEKYRPKDIVAQFFILFDDAMLHCNLIVTDENYYMYVHRKTTPIKDIKNDIVYTTQPNQRWNYRVGLTKLSDPLSMTIKRMIQESRVFYCDNETGEVLRNFILWSNDISSVKGEI